MTRRPITAQPRLQNAQPAIFDRYQSRGGDSGAAEERRVPKGAGLFDTDVEVVFCVGDERSIPRVLGGAEIGTMALPKAFHVADHHCGCPSLQNDPSLGPYPTVRRHW